MDTGSRPNTGSTPAVPALLSVGWLSVMVLMSSLGFASFGWWVLVVLVPATAVVFLGWRKANGSWIGMNSPERNSMFIRPGLAVLPMWVFAAILAATTDVWAPRRILVTLLTVRARSWAWSR